MEQELRALIDKIEKFSPPEGVDLVIRAYNEAKEAHGDQLRHSGEPFFVHPCEVANILADMDLDCESIAAGLLHDVIEDTPSSYEELKNKFGEEVAMLVEGVTKLEKIPYTSKEEQQVENLRKMFFAMTKDIRVILIKLADRLHNMRTIRSLSESKQRAKAKETLEVYAPLAHRLGMSKIKWELEDISLRVIDPIAYNEIAESIKQKRHEREEYIDDILTGMKEKLSSINIKCHIEGRAKHFFSIYKKMYAQGKELDEIYDLFAIRIIVDTINDCYGVLGLVHESYKPISGRFKDYIAMPKPNMYQSLHTTVIGPRGKPFEIQIRTWEMHRIAEFGIAAHWKYKEGKTASISELDKKLAWVRQLLDVQKELTDADEFMQSLKIDLFSDEVFVFTPKGDVINLPAGSTPIDYAYAIHSAVGNRMMGAKINGKIVPLEYKLQNGDIVEIITSASIHGPSNDWLKIVKTSQAKNKINQWFRREKRDENIIKGKEFFDREIKKFHFENHNAIRDELIDSAMKKYSYKSADDLYAAVGYGGVQPTRIAARFKEDVKRMAEELLSDEAHQKRSEAVQKTETTEKPRRVGAGVEVKGIDNCLVRLSRCCNPVPGDLIIGYITRGRGVSVHRRDCPNVQGDRIDEANRIIMVDWENEGAGTYIAEVKIHAEDRDSLLFDVSAVFSEMKIKVMSINARLVKDTTAVMDVTFEISHGEQIHTLSKRLRRVHGVFDIERAKK